MEVEMKAVLNDDQLRKLLNNEDLGICKTNEIREFLVKKDTYYSFNGEKIKKPKHITRIRKEAYIDAWNPGQKKPMHPIDLATGREHTEETHDIDIFSHAVTSFFNFNFDPVPNHEDIYLTIKEKHTDEKGIETNVENESRMYDTEAVEALLNSLNFKVYFEKDKRSISFWTDVNKSRLHLEIVSVNASDIYLEIECCIPDLLSKTEKEKLIDTTRSDIKYFFKEVLGITEFDGRSGAEIIGA